MPRKSCERWPGEGKCFHELTVPRREWRQLLHYARELDINDGAYYDGRIGAINFWCGPKNKPRDWRSKIQKRSLKHARAYVGAVFGDHLKSGNVRLHFDISAYDRAEEKGLTIGTPEWEKTMSGTAADRRWVLQQFKLLRQHVKLMRKGVTL